LRSRASTPLGVFFEDVTDMADLKVAPNSERIHSMKVGELRKSFEYFADVYNKMLDGYYMLCPRCNHWWRSDSFYYDKRYKLKRFPICKQCIQMMIEQRHNDKEEPNETKQSVQRVLHLMDKVYDDELYTTCQHTSEQKLKENARSSPFLSYITTIQALPQYSNKTWQDSKFGDSSDDDPGINPNGYIYKAGLKRFGSDYSADDILFLETEYEDWVSRYECKSKAQEEIFQRLSWIKLMIRRTQRERGNTKDLDKMYQDYLNTANITPKQDNQDSVSDSQTLGTLIQKWETTKPIPEPDPEFKDVDKIGLYITVFFKAHMMKILGLKDPNVELYDKEMAKYTVDKPAADEESYSEELFNKIFGEVDG
jgi:hypothetical protein